MSGNGEEPTYRVVGVRKNGERVVISSNSTNEIATKIVNLLKGDDFVDLHIEENPRPKKPNG
jgi:hypothetical protein